MGFFFKRSRAANSAVCGPIVLNFGLVRDIIFVFLTSKNEIDPVKNEGARVLTRLYFFIRSRAAKSKVRFGILLKSNSFKLL